MAPWIEVGEEPAAGIEDHRVEDETQEFVAELVHYFYTEGDVRVFYIVRQSLLFKTWCVDVALSSP